MTAEDYWLVTADIAVIDCVMNEGRRKNNNAHSNPSKLSDMTALKVQKVQ